MGRARAAAVEGDRIDPLCRVRWPQGAETITGPAPSLPVLIARNGDGRAADVTKIAPRTGHAIGFDGSSITFLEDLYGSDRLGAPRTLARAVQRGLDASNAWFNHMASLVFPETSERVTYVRIAAPEIPT